MKKRDYFISYSGENVEWAKWIAGTLERYGYSVYLQAWDIMPGDDFVEKMHRFLNRSQNYIAVLSNSFWKSAYCRREYQAAYSLHARQSIKNFIPIRIDDAEQDGLYNTIVYLDLRGLNERKAEDALLQGIGHKSCSRRTNTFPFCGTNQTGNSTGVINNRPQTNDLTCCEQNADPELDAFFSGFDEEVLLAKLRRPSDKE